MSARQVQELDYEFDSDALYDHDITTSHWTRDDGEWFHVVYISSTADETQEDNSRLTVRLSDESGARFAEKYPLVKVERHQVRAFPDDQVAVIIDAITAERIAEVRATLQT